MIVAIDSPPLQFLHIGDLHITAAALPNHLDLRRLVDEINRRGQQTLRPLRAAQLIAGRPG